MDIIWILKYVHCLWCYRLLANTIIISVTAQLDVTPFCLTCASLSAAAVTAILSLAKYSSISVHMTHAVKIQALPS